MAIENGMGGGQEMKQDHTVLQGGVSFPSKQLLKLECLFRDILSCEGEKSLDGPTLIHHRMQFTLRRAVSFNRDSHQHDQATDAHLPMTFLEDK